MNEYRCAADRYVEKTVGRLEAERPGFLEELGEPAAERLRGALHEYYRNMMIMLGDPEHGWPYETNCAHWRGVIASDPDLVASGMDVTILDAVRSVVQKSLTGVIRAALYVSKPSRRRVPPT